MINILLAKRNYPLDKKQTLNHGGSAQTHYPDKYAHMRARIDTVSHTRIEMAAILVYNQWEGCYRRIYPMRGLVNPKRTPVAWVYPRRKAVSIRVWDN